MFASPTLTIVLSRKVRKRTAHSVASATAWAGEPSPPFLISNPVGAPPDALAPLAAGQHAAPGRDRTPGCSGSQSTHGSFTYPRLG